MSLVISRTPFRVSFFGGGTDYPRWYLENGGAVLSTAINKYCYISCRYLPAFFGIRHRIVWSHIETVNSISEILHPAVRAGLQMLGLDDHAEGPGIELHHQGDLPARSGIGSSSAFAVGLVNGLSALRNRRLDRHELALAAIDLEQNQLGDSVGSQDQVAAAYGGFNVIRFGKDGSIAVTPVPLSVDRREIFQSRIMMFYTGSSRLSSELARELIQNFDAKRDHLRRMHAMVDDALETLTKGNLDDFGRMLDETWRLKRELGRGVTNALVDEIYDAGVDAGALGGKLLGAGASGFMVFFVPEECQAAVRKALRRLIHVPIQIDAAGSSIIYQMDS
jgi:D-glycero-alpha-D-manno-heptose-7-phosphate kinase